MTKKRSNECEYRKYLVKVVNSENTIAKILIICYNEITIKTALEEQMNLIESNFAPLKNVKISDSFWGKYQDIAINEIIPYQWKAINDEVPNTERTLKSRQDLKKESSEDLYSRTATPQSGSKPLRTALPCLPTPSLRRQPTDLST